MRIKGKPFSSFGAEKQGSGGPSGKAGPGRALPAGQQYIGFCGTKASTRHLKQQCRDILNSKDPAIKMAVEMSMYAIPNEYQLYFFLCKAKRVSEETGVSLIDAMNSLLEKFEELKKPEGQVDETKEETDGITNGASIEGTVESKD